MGSDFNLRQHLRMSPSAQVKNLVPETLSEIPAEEEWKLGRIWFNSTIGKFQSIFLKIDENTGLPLIPNEFYVDVVGEDNTNNTKINYSYKKLLGKEHTLNSTKWYDESNGIVLYQHAKEIWIDRINAPLDTDERFIKSFNDYELVADGDNKKLFYVRDENNFRLDGFIPPSYDIGYKIEIKIDDIIITEEHISQPLFDYANGILTFETLPPEGNITITCYQYIGRTFAQYIDSEYNSIAKGIIGLDSPESEYIIQHNMSTFDIDIVLYTYDEVEGTKYWKKDVVPMILVDENRIRLQLSEPQAIRFIIKSYDVPEL